MATSARTKTKNKPSLKSQGAGYSTTNSKGVTTYYKSAKDAPGYYDTANGKNVKTSPGKPLSRVNAAGTAIPVSDLTPAAPVPMPSKLVPADPGNVVGANNAGLATASNGMLTYDSTSNQLVPNTNEAATAPTATDNFSSLFNQYMGMQEAPPNTADLYAKEAKDAQLKQKQESVNNYTAQLNSIVAKSQADQLRLEGQGRGITDVIIGGQQAQINREAAIAALPVQAQLAAAQGDLEMAQQHVDKMFQIKSQDALAQYQYKSKVVDAVYNFATTQEQRRLDALKVQEDRKYAEQQDFLKTQRTLLSSALQQGAPQGVVSAINSATTQEDAIRAAGMYNGDILAREAQKANIAQSYASIRASNANAALNEAELAKLNDPTLSETQNADLAAYAMQFSDTGTLPSVSEMKLAGISASQVMDYAKQMPKPNGALVSTNTGTKSKTLSADQEKGIAALNEIVSKTLPDLKDRFGKINTGILGGLGGMVWTSQDRQDYLTFRQEFLSKLLVARSGAAVTEQEYERYAAMVPSTFNQSLFLGSDGMKKLNSLETSMKGNLDSVLNNNQLSVYGYSKVNVGGQKRTVGEVLDIGGTKYKVLPDGTLTDVI